MYQEKDCETDDKTDTQMCKSGDYRSSRSDRGYKKRKKSKKLLYQDKPCDFDVQYGFRCSPRFLCKRGPDTAKRH